MLKVRVTPNAARSQARGLVVDGAGEKRLALRVQAPPVEGQANEAVRRWAAETFDIRASRVRLVRGERGREKTILLAGLELAQAAGVLDRLLGEQDAADD